MPKNISDDILKSENYGASIKMTNATYRLSLYLAVHTYSLG